MSNTPYFDEYETLRERRRGVSNAQEFELQYLHTPTPTHLISSNPDRMSYMTQSGSSIQNPPEYRLKKYFDDSGRLTDVELERNINGSWQQVTV